MTRACPFCAETIRSDAVLCKHCHSRLDQPQDQPAPTAAATSTPRRGWGLGGRKPRSRTRRVVSGVLGVAAVLGLAAFAQSTTGILCGTDLPVLGLVTCDEVATGDRGDWYDARTASLKARTEFNSERTTCDILGMAAAVDDPVSRAEYQSCLGPAFDPFARTIAQSRGTGSELSGYLEGECRTAMDDWVKVLGWERDLARRFSSGHVELTRGRVSDGDLKQWERIGRIEKDSAATVQEACGM